MHFCTFTVGFSSESVSDYFINQIHNRHLHRTYSGSFTLLVILFASVSSFFFCIFRLSEFSLFQIFFQYIYKRLCFIHLPNLFEFFPLPWNKLTNLYIRFLIWMNVLYQSILFLSNYRSFTIILNQF